jgi:hypothetical protein
VRGEDRADPATAETLGAADAAARTAAATLPAAGDPIAARQPGTWVGRFVVLETIGIGGMGVVLAAYDPDLDRRVALKLLRPGRDGAPERLVREARAAYQRAGSKSAGQLAEVDAWLAPARATAR